MIRKSAPLRISETERIAGSSRDVNRVLDAHSFLTGSGISYSVEEDYYSMVFILIRHWKILPNWTPLIGIDGRH